jgi:hypothetical protein
LWDWCDENEEHSFAFTASIPRIPKIRFPTTVQLDRGLEPSAVFRFRDYRACDVSANVAPWGSAHSAIHDPPGTSCGSRTTVPPSDITFSVTSFTLGTSTYDVQLG